MKSVFFSDISVDVPDSLDLSHLQGKGKQPGEVELPSDDPKEPGIWSAKKYRTVISCMST